MSDSRGMISIPDGMDSKLLEKVKKLKAEGGSLSELDESGVEYKKDAKPWEVECDFAFPCATQNELELEDAKKLIEQNCQGIFEGANMPCTTEAIDFILDKGLLFGPAKAANAGGVAVSALEMSQNHVGMSWERDRVDEKLKEIMKSIFDNCVKHGEKEDGKICYNTGANIAGFVKVADAMIAYGIN